MRSHRALALALGLALGLASLGAQEGRRILVSLSSSSLDLQTWTSTLEGSLAMVPPIAGVLRARPGEDIRDQARLSGCDLVLVVKAESRGDGVEVSWRVLSPALPRSAEDSGGDALKEGSFEGSLPSSRRLAEGFWKDLAAAVAEMAVGIGARPTAPEGMVSLLVEADPGSLIQGLGQDLRVPEDGRIELQLASPETYAWKAGARGRMPASGTLVLSGGDSVLRIELERIRSFAIGLDLHQAAFPGLSLSWSCFGDRLTASFLFDQFLFGINLSSGSNRSESLVWSVPVVQPGLGLSWTFAGPESGLRPYLALEAFARLTPMTGSSMGIDALAPLILAPRLGLEWRPSPPWGIYFQLGADWYPGCDGILMAASNAGSSLSFAYADTWYLEYPAFSLGLRFRP